ncbi:type IV pilus modification protein PilV [Massilia glaciei]|uniref:Type IV pilus modification protein PilV n=1 Tax=Massilia glaciei TaxID=1524097 RepID=A0A2U2HKF9_9BURK|nr:type IV pilus modification protein PilV [Massilia glaciei]PWF47945.1 type IV pilus modification protein PilV [Massilia glaciei]
MRPAGGFTLLEVLIAVLVLAIGVVGASGAHITAMRTRHESALMSEAVQLAVGLAERMRANAPQMRLADGANPYARLQYDAQAEGAPKAPPTLCYGRAVCGSAELAQFDLHELKQILHARFPGGRVLVCRDSKLWDAGAGALAWQCAGGAAAPLVIKLGWRAKNTDGTDARDNAGRFGPSVAIMVPREAS